MNAQNYGILESFMAGVAENAGYMSGVGIMQPLRETELDVGRTSACAGFGKTVLPSK